VRFLNELYDASKRQFNVSGQLLLPMEDGTYLAGILSPTDFIPEDEQELSPIEAVGITQDTI